MNSHDLGRFLLKITKKAQCWEWAARKNASGYGLFVMGHSKVFLAHRVAYEHWVGPFPNTMRILHRCDNPPCVNPDHLFVGTQADNVRDMVAKGRNVCVPMPGEKNPQAKLTREQVDLIREMYVPRVVTLRRLADKFGVSEATIHGIVTGKKWA